MKNRIVLSALLAIAFCAVPASAQFAWINGGVLPPCPSSASLGTDNVNGVLYVGTPTTHCWSADEFSLAEFGPQTALTNVTTAQTMFTFTPGAAFMNIQNRILRICGEAMFSNGVTTPAITVSVKIGASITPVSVTTASNANSNTNAPLNFCFSVMTTTTGSSGADEAHGWVSDATAGVWASGTAVSTYVDGNTAASSTYDHTAANAIAIQIASTAALTSVTPRWVTMELVN